MMVGICVQSIEVTGYLFETEQRFENGTRWHCKQ